MVGCFSSCLQPSLLSNFFSRSISNEVAGRGYARGPPVLQGSPRKRAMRALLPPSGEVRSECLLAQEDAACLQGLGWSSSLKQLDHQNLWIPLEMICSSYLAEDGPGGIARSANPREPAGRPSRLKGTRLGRAALPNALPGYSKHKRTRQEQHKAYLVFG